MHVPQSYEAAVELEEIAAIPHNVVSPRHAKPLIGTFQDSVVGSYRITRPTSRFNRREFMNLMMRNKRFDGLLPKLNEQGLYTGQQVISQLLPPLNVNIPDKLTIDQGNITMGQLTSGVYMEPGKGIIHILYNDYGPKETTMFLDSLQRVIEDYLVLNGFSVGISDLVADDKTTEGIKKTIEDCKKKIEELQLLVHMDLFENNTGKTNQEEFEDKAYSILNEANGTAEKAVKKSLSSENRLVAMINSGSKGKWLNIAQMIACLGQQSIENKRVPYGFTDRTLPHYKRYDDGAEARGFVESSFIKGLTPQELYMHAISGREGLIDTAVKTADTGYIQRQLIKALEDFVVHHDRTVRDANMNVLQFEYGEDGIAATKVEDQALPKYSEMSKETIETTYGLKGVAWGEVLLEGVSRPAGEQDLLNLHVQQILEDQKILVEQVYKNSEFGGDVKSPVNLARMILNIKTRFGLGGKTDLTVYTVLTRIPVILERTRSTHNHIWGALLRYYLSPHKILVEDRFTVKALDALTELIVVAHMKSWVQPGEQVGIVAAQSIGEPSTQLTLNSVAWDERIIIAKDGKLISPMIGAFIDDYQATCDPKRVQFLEKGQIYIDLKEDGHKWQAFSCDENGKAVWTTLEAITKHPVVNEDGTDTILEVELESGRTVKATKGKSFLTIVDGLLTATNGSELKIGDELPCSLSLGIKELGTVGTLDLRSILPLTEWIYGSEVTKALTIMNSENAKGNRHWFQVNQGSAFTVPYNRSDSFRDAFVNGKNPHDVREGHVYPKNIHLKASQIPAVLALDAEFGFFCGAYLAEGMSNKTQVNLTNNESSYLDSVQKLMDRWDVGTHRVEGPKHAKETTDIKGYTTSLVIHSTVLAKVMGTLFGKTSYQKDIPDWVLQAPDVFVKALVDGYVSGDGCVSLSGSITYSSVSEALITKMNAIMARYGIFTVISKRMPDIRKFKSVSMHYTSYIGQYHTTLFANQFTLCIPKKQERLNAHLKSGAHRFMRTLMGDVALDKIKTIKEIRPLKELVYDLTVEKTRNFMLLNTVNCADTFHTAGVATKNNVTTGIPRLREILKVTKNPKASSLTIPMKAEFNETDERGREKAREIKQDLELTLLRHITNKVAIYWDPTDEATVIEEDREMLKFYREMELDMPSSNLLTATEGDTTKINPWLLRFELNREEMYNKNITMADVVFVIKTIYNTVKLVYSDYNAQSLIMRIRMEFDMEQEKTYEDYFSLLKKFENKMLNSCVIRGVPGIKAVTFRKDEQKVFLVNGKYEKKSQYILDTDGSNYVRVMNHPAVDANRLYTTNIHDIMDILGLEAVRAILLSEIMPIFSSEAVNYRHLGILCDYITRSGRLMSVDRYGVNKNETGPLGKMSFEETTKIVMDAARFGEVDPMNGVSANIMMGQPFRGGTAFSQILLDDDMLMKLSSEGPVYEPEEDNESVTSVEDVMDADAPCSTAQFRINMVMPSIHRSQEEDLDEDDVELIPLQTTT